MGLFSWRLLICCELEEFCVYRSLEAVWGEDGSSHSEPNLAKKKKLARIYLLNGLLITFLPRETSALFQPSIANVPMPPRCSFAARDSQMMNSHKLQIHFANPSGALRVRAWIGNLMFVFFHCENEQKGGNDLMTCFTDEDFEGSQKYRNYYNGPDMLGAVR